MALLVLGAGWVLWRFQATVLQGLHDATRFASDISACNLATSVGTDYPEPLGALMQRKETRLDAAFEPAPVVSNGLPSEFPGTGAGA